MSGAWGIQAKAQLTYASFETAQRGGWQVKEIRGHLPETERDYLLSKIPSTLPTPAAGRFVTEEEVAAWPRRLAYLSPHRESGVQQAMLHSAPAGPDRSGREGNVFTHTAVMDSTSGRRPIEAWRSPTWLTPYGADDVEVASLQSDEIVPVAGVFQRVADFLAGGEVWRPGVLAVLLDAIRPRLMGSGDPVALLVEDTDEAARWIEAVSVCMASRTAERLSFSTVEAARARDSWDANGFTLVCLLSTERADLARAEGVVVVDASDPGTTGILSPEAGSGEVPEPHVTARGDAVPVTVWSSLMFELVAGADDIAEYERLLTELEEQVAGEDSTDPSWWLAAVALRGGSTEYEAAASRVAALAAPSGVSRTPQVEELVSGCLFDTMGGSTAERWRYLQEMQAQHASEHMLRLATVAYVESAFGDLEWMSRAPEYLPGVLLRTEPSEEVRRLAGSFQDRPKQVHDLSSEDWAVAGVRIIDLIYRLGWDAELIEGMEAVGQVWVRPTMREGAPFVNALRRAGHVVDFTTGMLRNLAAHQARSTRLDPAVLSELGYDKVSLDGTLGVEDPWNVFHDGSFTPLGLQVLDLRWQRSPSKRLDELAMPAAVAASQLRRDGDPTAAHWASAALEGRLSTEQAYQLVKDWGELVSPELIIKAALGAQQGDMYLDRLVQSSKLHSMPRQLGDFFEAMEVLTTGKWTETLRPRLGPGIRHIIDTVTLAPSGHQRPMQPYLMEIMMVMAVCALVRTPDPEYARLSAERFAATRVTDEVIAMGRSLVSDALPGDDGEKLCWMFPFMVPLDRQLVLPGKGRGIGNPESRNILLRLGGMHGQSVVERLIAAFIDVRQWSWGAVEPHVNRWAAAIVGDEGEPKDLSRPIKSWFHKHTHGGESVLGRIGRFRK